MNQAFVEAVSGFSGVSSVLSGLCAAYTVWRSGQWRRDGAGKQVLADIVHAQATADQALRAAGSWTETEIARTLNARVERNAARIALIEGELANTATKADVARIEGSIAGVSHEVRAAAAGIDRIEGYFLEQAIKAPRGGAR